MKKKIETKKQRERERVGNIYLFTNTKKGAFVHELIEESLTHQYIIFKRNKYSSVHLIERGSERGFFSFSFFVFVVVVVVVVVIAAAVVVVRRSEELRDRERTKRVKKENE